MAEVDIKVPFCIERGSSRTLVEQVFDGVRSAIVCGHYKVGDVLPMRTIGEKLGVSRIVINKVVAKLKDVGLANPRKHVGCVVLGRHERLWKGHVLLVMRGEYGTYYINVLAGAIREELIKAGYLVSTVATPFDGTGKPDVLALSTALRQSVDLAIVVFNHPMIERCVARSGVKFILVGDRLLRSKNCVGSITYRRADAIREFVPILKREGVRTLMEVGCGDFADAKEKALEVGMRYASWVIPAKKDGIQPEATGLAAMEAFRKRLAKGRSWLPDALYFSDDFTASGALTELLVAGVRIPEDVRVIAWSNRGNGPLAPFPIDLAQTDPREDGRYVASAALEAIRGCPSTTEQFLCTKLIRSSRSKEATK